MASADRCGSGSASSLPPSLATEGVSVRGPRESTGTLLPTSRANAHSTTVPSLTFCGHRLATEAASLATHPACLQRYRLGTRVVGFHTLALHGFWATRPKGKRGHGGEPLLTLQVCALGTGTDGATDKLQGPPSQGVLGFWFMVLTSRQKIWPFCKVQVFVKY